jgi:hypothetical protein
MTGLLHSDWKPWFLIRSYGNSGSYFISKLKRFKQNIITLTMILVKKVACKLVFYFTITQLCNQLFPMILLRVVSRPWTKWGKLEVTHSSSMYLSAIKDTYLMSFFAPAIFPFLASQLLRDWLTWTHFNRGTTITASFLPTHCQDPHLSRRARSHIGGDEKTSVHGETIKFPSIGMRERAYILAFDRAVTREPRA